MFGGIEETFADVVSFLDLLLSECRRVLPIEFAAMNIDPKRILRKTGTPRVSLIRVNFCSVADNSNVLTSCTNQQQSRYNFFTSLLRLRAFSSR